jgi:prepilin-type N-terminal cleavage/methylation domain-containing protein
MTSSLKNRPGFSLSEVLVATVLLGIIGGALTKLVVDQMRFFDNVTAVRGARSVGRSSMNVMLADLRMVQDRDGVKTASTSSITFRVPYRFGFFCGSTAGLTTVSLLPADSATVAMATYAGYAVRDRVTGIYTVPSVNPLTQAAVIPSVAPALCTTTAGINVLTINGRSGTTADVTPLTVSTSIADRGRAVYFYQEITYHFANSALYPGKTGLYRQVLNGANGDEELMAPFTSGTQFKFYTKGSDVSSATVPGDLNTITGVEVVLNAIGTRTPAGRKSAPQQSMSTAIYFKNVR